MGHTSITEIEWRLESLERQGHRWRLAAMASAMALVATLVTGAQRRDEIPRTVRAGGLSVVNEDGREVVRIGSNPQERGQGLVVFLDKSGKPRLKMGLMASDGPFHMLIGQDSRH